MISKRKSPKDYPRSKLKSHLVCYKYIGMLFTELNSTGEANVLQFFEVNDGKKKIGVAGSRCTKGLLKKASLARLARGEDIVYEGQLATIQKYNFTHKLIEGKIFELRHLKNEVDSIKKDVECGIRLDKSDLQFEPGDVIQCYVLKDESQKCEWDPGF
jgi:translation initiation factor IF-2